MDKKSQIVISQSEPSRTGSLEAHNALLSEILLALSKQGLCRVWRSETGMALNPRTQKPFHYGLKGSADITGILQNGKRLEIEIKTGNAKQSEQQKMFAAMIHKYNGHYLVCRSVEDACNFVKHCLS